VDCRRVAAPRTEFHARTSDDTLAQRVCKSRLLDDATACAINEKRVGFHQHQFIPAD
jgi:hypothetical protein